MTLLLAALSGCGDNPLGSKPQSTAPKPVTAADVQAQISAILAPAHALARSAQPDTPVPADLPATFRAQLDTQRKGVPDAKVYKEGAHNAVKMLEDDLRVARDAQNPVVVLLLCDLIRYLEPGNARLPRFEKWANTVKDRPFVTIRGWYEPRDTTVRIIYAFLEIYTPADGQMHYIEVREGEEFLNLKFVKMLGNKRGIRFEYTVTGDQFDVYSNSWQQQQ